MTLPRHLTRNLLYLLISTSLVVTLGLFYHVHPFASRRKSLAEAEIEEINPHKYLAIPLTFPPKKSRIDDDHRHKQHKHRHHHVLDAKLTEPQEEMKLEPQPPPQTMDRVSFVTKENEGKVLETSTISGENEIEDDTTIDIFSLDQTDPMLIRYIRKHHLKPPSKLPYANMTSYGQHPNWYSNYIHSLFQKINGSKTFIEAGAYDGEVASNSLYLEEMGWTGLLVECNPLLLPKLMAKNRKAWIANVCLSPGNTPKMMNFTTLSEWPASAKLGRPLNAEEMIKHGLDWVHPDWTNYQIPCFPLYSIIKAIGDLSEIDFLSLDVEGAEIDILKAFPFDKLKIKAMIVEVHTFSKEDKTHLREFIGSKGYELREKIQNDDIYVLKTEVDLKK